jgi:hypothetical protein
MIEKIIEYSVRNPLLVIILTLAVAGVGVYSVIQTPVDAIPDLSENQVIVFADWPGRSPKEVEDLVCCRACLRRVRVADCPSGICVRPSGIPHAGLWEVHRPSSRPCRATGRYGTWRPGNR